MAWHRIATPAVLMAMACAPGPRGANSAASGSSALPEAEVVRRAVAELTAALMPPAAVCVSFRGWQGPEVADSTPGWLRTLSERAVPESRCPPSYASMVVVVDSAGRPLASRRPPGYVDPYHVAVWKPVAVEAGRWLVRVESTQGMGGERYYCEVVAGPTQGAKCALFAVWVH